MEPRRRDFLMAASAVAGSSILDGCAGNPNPSAGQGRCIVVSLQGGASQVDTFDPKKTGWFPSRATSVAGMVLSEHFPALAEHARDLAFIRSMAGIHTHHELASAHMRRGLECLGESCTVGGPTTSTVEAPSGNELRLEYRSRLQAALVAAEQGERLVLATLGGWDTHTHARDSTRMRSCALDDALDDFLSSAAWRRLRSNTVVLISGEFGRDPDLNDFGGRGHHIACWTAIVAGGRFRSGIVRGATDTEGRRSVVDETQVEELHATVLAALDEPSAHDFAPINSLLLT